MTIQEAIRAGELDGYYQRAPSARCAEEDAKIVAGWDCPQCGHHSLGYRAFSKPGSYRPFFVCGQCGFSAEF